MKISVVIPAYNEEHFLPHLLKSLKTQTFPPHEIIVVDNNSTDQTEKIARQFKAKVVFEPKRGYAFACNKGFYRAKGDIIARADADYIVPKQWLENIQREFKKDKKLVALGGPLYTLESSWWQNIVYYPISLVWMYVLKLLGRGFLFPNMAVRRDTFLKTKGFNTKRLFGEDTDMCLTLVKMGRVKIFPHIYVHTSMRRVHALGVFKMVFGYSFANQITLWRGGTHFIGLEPIRVVQQKNPHPKAPWMYVLAIPMLLFFSLSTILYFNHTTPARAETLRVRSQQAITSIEKRVSSIKHRLANQTLKNTLIQITDVASDSVEKKP